MKKILLTLIFVSSALLSHSQQWNLIWSDEFSSNSIDENKWGFDIGTGSQYGLWGWGNNESQYYTEENASVNGGSLIIEAKEEPNGLVDSWNNTKNYSSAKLTTKNTFSFKYGKVEARMKTIDGEGFWPAFWMLPTEGCWPESGEIDIMEQWANDGPSNITTGAAHQGFCESGSTYNHFDVELDESYANDFHTYAVIWYEDYIGWYVDDVLHYQVNPSNWGPEINWAFNSGDWYIMLNLAITEDGPSANTVFPNQIEVDYVRVYQTADVVGCTDPNASNYNSQANVADEASCLYEVTFNVNMNCSEENPGTVYVSGQFNNWCGNCTPLSDSDGDGIWSGTYAFSYGETIDYKYSIDNWASQENLIDDMQNGGNCAPVTDYNDYANREITVNSNMSTYDSYDSCQECIPGCTNSSSSNYNPAANYNDGSCDEECPMTTINFSVELPDGLPNGYSNVVVNGSWNGWNGWGITLQDNNNDNIWEGSQEFENGSFEFIYALTGPVDEYSGWGTSGDVEIGSSCDFNPTDNYGNYGFTAYCGNDISLSSCFQSCEPCIVLEDVYGCTDPTSPNYNPEATIDDGSCYSVASACDAAPFGLEVTDIIHNRITFNWMSETAPDYYMIRYRPTGASNWTVITAGSINNSDYNGTSRTRYFMEPNTSYQWSIRNRELNQDGSVLCQSLWSATATYTTLPMCANLENLSVSTEANWVRFIADAPSSEWGVWQSKGKIRENGYETYRYINGDVNGNIDFLKGNFNASANYQWHTKSWCTTNNVQDPMYHSGWGEFSAFTTEDPCDAIATNLTTSTNGPQTAIVMNWDSPLSGNPDHYFLELTNETTGQVFQWNNIAGNTNSKTKFGQTTGDQFSWRIRGACGANGTSWATSFTAPSYYTLGGNRIQSPLTQLDIYPNPTNGIVNINYTLNELQEVELVITNAIGKVIYRNKEKVKGSTFKLVDLSKEAKGIYLLQLKTANQSNYQKIALQ